MRITTLNPTFLGAGGPGIYNADMTPSTPRHGVGILMDCPCGNADESHQLYVPFKNPLDGGPSVNDRGWDRAGDTFDTLTLNPSVLRLEGCKWHGWIKNGEATSC